MHTHGQSSAMQPYVTMHACADANSTPYTHAHMFKLMPAHANTCRHEHIFNRRTLHAYPLCRHLGAHMRAQHVYSLQMHVTCYSHKLRKDTLVMSAHVARIQRTRATLICHRLHIPFAETAKQRWQIFHAKPTRSQVLDQAMVIYSRELPEWECKVTTDKSQLRFLVCGNLDFSMTAHGAKVGSMNLSKFQGLEVHKAC